MNAAYIEKLGYSRHFDTLSADHLKAFLYDLPVFEKKLAAHEQNGNEVLFGQLDEVLNKTIVTAESSQ